MSLVDSLALDTTINADAQLLSRQLSRLRDRLFPPASQKVMRRFGSGEVARLVGISDSYLRQLSLANEGPVPEKSAGGRRLYSLEQVHQLRQLLAARGRYPLPTRSGCQHLQVLAIANFKGGSGKTAILSGPPARVSLGDLGCDVGRWF